MDGERRILEDASVVVDGDRIVDVGPRAEIDVRHPAATRRLGGDDVALLPGLVDAHGHAGHSLIKALASDAPRTWESVVTPFYFNWTTPEFWYLDGLVSAIDRLRVGVTTSVSVMASEPRSDVAWPSTEHARAYGEVGLADIVCVGPSGLPYPYPSSVPDGAGWRARSTSLAEMLDVTEEVVRTLDGTRGGLTRVFVTPFSIVPSVDSANPSTPDAAVRLTDGDREHARGVRELAARYGVRIHSDAFGGQVRLALQDDEYAILGPDVLLQHCIGISEEEIAMLAATGTHFGHAPGGEVNVPAMMAQGINVALTTDGCAPLRPFDLLQAARGVRSAHQVRTGDPYLFPPGKLLEMITVDAAKALGMEHEIGSIEIGKRADLVLLDTAAPHLTPWWMPVHRIMLQAVGRDVRTVVVAGEVLLEDRVATRVDEADVLREAGRYAAAAVREAGLEAHLTDPGWGQVQRVFT